MEPGGMDVVVVGQDPRTPTARDATKTGDEVGRERRHPPWTSARPHPGRKPRNSWRGDLRQDEYPWGGRNGREQWSQAVCGNQGRGTRAALK